MKEFKEKVSMFLRDEEGVTAMEYGLIAALIAVVIIAGTTLVGDAINTQFSAIGGKISETVVQ